MDDLLLTVTIRDIGRAWEEEIAKECRPRSALETFEVERPRGRYAARVRHALQAIDAVHEYAGLPRLPLRFNASTVTVGQLALADGLPYKITISTKNELILLTTLHEAGHFVDHQGFGEPGVFSSRVDVRFNGWWTAVQSSAAYRELERVLPLIAEGGLVTARCLPYFAQLGHPEELWARSYTQYIALRSGDPACLEELAKARERWYEPYVPEQWEDDDFLSIAKALDDLLLVPARAPAAEEQEQKPLLEPAPFFRPAYAR